MPLSVVRRWLGKDEAGPPGAAPGEDPPPPAATTSRRGSRRSSLFSFASSAHSDPAPPEVSPASAAPSAPFDVVLRLRGPSAVAALMQGEWITQRGTRTSVRGGKVFFAGPDGSPCHPEPLRVTRTGVTVMGVSLELGSCDSHAVSWSDGDRWVRPGEEAGRRGECAAAAQTVEAWVNSAGHPRCLVVRCGEQPDVSGTYQLLAERRNGRPVWGCSDSCLYSSTEGFWMFANKQKMDEDVGVLCSSAPHEGTDPDQVLMWEYFAGPGAAPEGWIACADCNITRLGPTPVPSPELGITSPQDQASLTPGGAHGGMSLRTSLAAAARRLTETAAGDAGSLNRSTRSSGGRSGEGASSSQPQFNVSTPALQPGLFSAAERGRSPPAGGGGLSASAHSRPDSGPPLGLTIDMVAEADQLVCVAGQYALVPGVAVQGQPLWRNDVGCWLYTTAEGIWAITDCEADFAQGRFLVNHSGPPTGGCPPLGSSNWQTAAGADFPLRIRSSGSSSAARRPSSSRKQSPAEMSPIAQLAARRKPSSGGLPGVAAAEAQGREELLQEEGAERVGRLSAALVLSVCDEVLVLFDDWQMLQEQIGEAATGSSSRPLSPLVRGRDKVARLCSAALSRADAVTARHDRLAAAEGQQPSCAVEARARTMYDIYSKLSAFFAARREVLSEEERLAAANRNHAAAAAALRRAARQADDCGGLAAQDSSLLQSLPRLSADLRLAEEELECIAAKLRRHAALIPELAAVPGMRLSAASELPASPPDQAKPRPGNSAHKAAVLSEAATAPPADEADGHRGGGAPSEEEATAAEVNGRGCTASVAEGAAASDADSAGSPADTIQQSAGTGAAAPAPPPG